MKIDMMDKMKDELRSELVAEREADKEHYRKKEAEMNSKIERIQHHIDELEMKVEKQEAAMKQELNSLQTSLTTAVSQVRDLPYLMVCAYGETWTTADTTITYDSLLSDYN